MVAGMSDLLARALGEQVQVETVLAAGLWRINADVSQLENAVLNLAVNGRDAMPNGGRLTVETANTFVSEEYADEHSMSPGQYVMIAVTDTGTGMSSDTLAKAFDPFFTTKEVGKGSGLGLKSGFWLRAPVRRTCEDLFRTRSRNNRETIPAPPLRRGRSQRDFVGVS